MVAGICIACAELFEGARACPRCGSKLAREKRDILAWEWDRQRKRIAGWIAAGVIDEAKGKELVARIVDLDANAANANAASAANANAADAKTVEQRADAAVSAAGELFGEMATRWKKLAQLIDEDSPKSARDDAGSLQHDDRTVEAGRALFVAQQHAAVVGAGVEALAGLDEHDPAQTEPSKPFGALQVFWFIGTTFVLAGSVMGVREAWRTLEGVWRPVVIAGAFFAYHVLFVGLARLLVKRSAVTGRVLAGIAAGLLPVVFVAAAVAIGQRAAVGVPFSIALFAASLASLVLVGRPSDRHAPGLGLALALGLSPALLIELAIGSGGATDGRRGLLVLVALVPVAVAATRARSTATTSSIIALFAAAYGAVAVALLGLYGGPGDAPLPFDHDGIAGRALVAWLAASAAIAWWASSGAAMAARLARFAAVPFVLALAVLVSTAAAALVMGLVQSEALSDGVHVPLAVLALATVVLAVEQRTRPSVLHIAVLVSLAMMLLVAKTFVPDRGELWAPTCAVVPACFLLFGALVGDRRRRAILATWGIISGTLLLLVTVIAEWSARGSTGDAQLSARVPWLLTAMTGGALALSAHAGARTSRPSLHLFGAAFALVATLAWVLPPASSGGWPAAVLFACAGLAAAYGALGLGYARFAVKEDDRRPLDDASLFLATGAVWFGVVFAQRAGIDDTFAERLGLAVPALLLAALLFARSLRDRSALVVAQGAAALVVAAASFCGVRAFEDTEVWFYGGLAGVFAALATLRVPRGESEPRLGRALFGLVPLPLSGGPRTLLDGFALASLALAPFAVLPAVGWLGASPRSEATRITILLGLVGISCAFVLAFATRAFERFRARGSAATLWVAAPLIGLTAVVYRIGRPLPPDVTGFRLSIVIVLVWLGARGLVKIGPRLAAALDRPSEGPRYHHVAHGGVLALALLLLVDALLVGGPTLTRSLAVVPPLLLAGSALGLYLLYRSYGREPLLHGSVLACAGAFFLAFAQRSVLGPTLLPLDPPGGRWMLASTMEAARSDWLDPARFLAAGDSELALWNRGWLGLSAAAVVIAALLAGLTRSPALARIVPTKIFAREVGEAPAIERALAVPLTVLAVLLAFGLAWQPSLPAALAFVVAGALAAAALTPTYRVVTLVLAAPALVHALAQSGPRVPMWGGPAMALLVLAAVVHGARAARGARPRRAETAAAQIVAIAYTPIVIAYALAAGGTTSAVAGAPRILALAADSLVTSWLVSYAPALSFAILALAAAIAAFAWRGGLAKIFFVAPPLVLGIAGLWFSAAFTSLSGPDALALLITREGPLVAASLAVAAAIAHVAAFQSARAARADAAVGLSVGRDLVLGASALVMCFFVAMRTPGGFLEGPCGAAALGLAVAVSVHAIAWQGTARHVAFVETLLVAFYAFATRAFHLRPEIDALVGLLYGFSLLGVAVVARRRNVDTVADATRRFAAVLPLAIAIFTLRRATNETAGLALGASVLYGSMAYVERSRIFGSLAALAANLGLVVFAVAQGLDGAEIYIGPLGIFVTALAQIFAPKMTPAARSTLRIIGGGLLYLPAGLKLTFQLGAAEDGTYSVVFGAVCLLGVVVGLVLRVRAYLALGTLFLTLDVIANLVHAGLRDHRIGFVLLSVSGLAILGIMIGITLRRDRTWAAVGLLRSRLRAWD